MMSCAFAECNRRSSGKPSRIASRSAQARRSTVACSQLGDALLSAKRGLGALALAVALHCAQPLEAGAEGLVGLSNDAYLADVAKVVPSGARDALDQRLKALQRDTGFRVRIITGQNLDGNVLDEARRVWGVDRRTIILQFDPSSPNIFGYDYIGDDVLLNVLRRPFWIELQSRYGNMFFVRDKGEAAAVEGVVDAVDECIRAGGCRVVPGLPEEQYYFTLITSVAGGLIFGFSSRLPADSRVQRQWVWALLFAPLWGTLFFSFGIGPIVARTDDKLGIALNTAAFLVAALLFKPAPFFFDEKKP